MQHSINREDEMTTLEHDLNHVEQTLQEQPQNNSVFQWSGQAQRGRAVFESLGSALGSIRQRYQQLQSSMSTTTTNNDNSDNNTSINASSLSLPTDFEGRLATAERAHSTRMPLGMIRQQLSSSMHPNTTATEHQAAAAAASLQRNVDAKTEDDGYSDADGSSAASAVSSSSTTTGSPSKRHRRPSTLVASRRFAEAHETNDIQLHEQVALLPLEPSPPLPTTPQQQQQQLLPEQQHNESEDRRHTDIVLPVASLQKLDSNKHHGHVLLPFASSSSDFADLPDQPIVPTLYCWGDSPHYSLGTESTETSVTSQPKPIPTHARLGRSELVNVSLGDTHAAFATTSGSLLICGNNTEGAVDPSQRQTPSILLPMHLESILVLTPRILQVACGFDHTAVITETRAVLTFGNNMDGQLGHRQPTQKKTATTDGGRFQHPAAMVLPQRAAQVVCGHRFTAVLTTRMEVYVCGREEITGYNTLEGPPRLPEQSSALQGLPIVYMAAGDQHVVVLTAQGTAYAWGANPTGACGREFPKLLSVPVPIQVPQSSMEQPLQPNGRLPPTPFSNWAAWEVGSPNIITLAEDVAVVDAACGKDFTVLVTKTGHLLVAGSNHQQQLGIVDTSSSSSNEATEQFIVPVQSIDHPNTTQGASFVSAEAGTHHTVLLDNQGNIWTMGKGNPLSLVLEGQSIATIAAGGEVTIAIASKGESAKTQTSSLVTPGLEGLLDGILLEKEVSKQESAVQELANQTEELFRCPAVMNSVFLDPKEIDDLYSKLISAAGEQKYRQLVVSAMENGMMKGLDSIKTARLMYPEAVRCLLLYLQCPLFRRNDTDGCSAQRDVQFDVRGDAIQLLCETILGLPFEGYKALTAWSTSVYAKELFVPFLVKPLMDQLNSKILTERTRAVPVIVGVLRWFQNVAERYPDDVDAKPEDFHSSGVAQLPMEALFDDLIRYKRSSKAERGVNFFLCGSPFLLSPSCKRNLLQVEHQFTMVHAAQSQGVTFDLARRQFLFNPYFVMAIDRQYLLQQTLQAVASAAPGELRKSLKIVFKGEDGVDAGGVTKEFFQLLVVQLFDINTGMWTSHYGDGMQTWFNADCTWNQDGYFLVGVLVGLAVYNSVILDVHFPQAVYRKLLGLPLGLEDMVDPEIQKGLKTLLEYNGDDVEDVFCLTFEVTWNSLGMERKRELKPGGADIPVTSDNREEYVMQYVKWLLMDSIESQYNEFERGFLQVMEGSSLDLLRPEELELLVVGTPELDFEALQRNAEYEGGYDKDSPVVQNLWRFVKESDRETQLNFLKFSTGTNKAPIGGLGEMPFKVQRAGPDSMQLPTSHTCFNTLLVPDYGDNYEKLKERLGRAILECEGFGLQ